MAGQPLSLPPANLSPWRVYALIAIREAKHPMTRAALALRLDSSPSSIGALLLGLRADGLVQRVENGTAAGYTVTQAGIRAMNEFFHSMFALSDLWQAATKPDPHKPPAATRALSDAWQQGEPR
jgi:hypothetical protein